MRLWRHGTWHAPISARLVYFNLNSRCMGCYVSRYHTLNVKDTDRGRAPCDACVYRR
eukprot:m.19459 g.19459  ORF g.19459 m.19459 type:complete len:57 (-) comp11830_c0_seq1:20-190(-)